MPKKIPAEVWREVERRIFDGEDAATISAATGVGESTISLRRRTLATAGSTVPGFVPRNRRGPAAGWKRRRKRVRTRRFRGNAGARLKYAASFGIFIRFRVLAAVRAAMGKSTKSANMVADAAWRNLERLGNGKAGSVAFGTDDEILFY